MTRPVALIVLAGLLFAAVMATVADGAAYLAIIGSGHAAETNPIVARLAQPVALWAKTALVVYVISVTVLAVLLSRPGVAELYSARTLRALRFTVGLALVVALVGGLTGVITTVGSAG